MINSSPRLSDMLSTAEMICRLKQNSYQQPFPSKYDRNAWEKLKHHQYFSSIALNILALAAELAQKKPHDLSYKLVTDYICNGLRSYDNPYLLNRNRLIVLIIAEALENKGRFIEEIADGIWRILGEVSWALPCHQKFSGKDFVPDPGLATIDLFASETAMILNFACEILDLKSYSPALVGWISQNLEYRIFTPLEQGAGKYLNGRNNWTPWVSSNLALVILSFLDGQPERQERLLRPLLKINDVFILHYHDDGACDEGPGYWIVSAPRLFFMIYMLNKRTGNGYADFFRSDKIRNMGEFIVNSHISKKFFFNFSDCGKVQVPAGILWLYGKKCKSSEMCDFAEAAVREIGQEYNLSNSASVLLTLLQDFFYLPEEIQRNSLTHELDTVLEDSQIYVFREKKESGLVSAIKGGVNLPEGHNHNDCGHFIIYNNNSPVIIDIGAQPYNRETFSENRYNIWHIGGGGHNAAVINNFSQYANENAKTTVVEYHNEDKYSSVILELSATYPQEAGVESYLRKMIMDREQKEVVIIDRFAGAKDSQIQIKLFSP